MSPNNRRHLVFVYGTLKQAYGNNRVMREAGGVFRTAATTETPYPLVVQGLPYLYDRPGIGLSVKGEVYSVPGHGVLRCLDRLEGHPRFYTRKQITVVTPAGTSVLVWCYFIASRPFNPKERFVEEYGHRCTY